MTFLLLAIIESHCRQWWPSFLLFFYAIFKIFNVFTQKCPIILMSRPQVLIWCRCIFFHSGVHLPSNSVNHVLLFFNLNKNTITTLTLLLCYLSLKSTSILFSHRTKKNMCFYHKQNKWLTLSNNNILTVLVTYCTVKLRTIEIFQECLLHHEENS